MPCQAGLCEARERDELSRRTASCDEELWPPWLVPGPFTNFRRLMLQQPYSNLRSRLLGTALPQFSRVERGMLRHARDHDPWASHHTWHLRLRACSLGRCYVCYRVLPRIDVIAMPVAETGTTGRRSRFEFVSGTSLRRWARQIVLIRRSTCKTKTTLCYSPQT